MVDHGVIDIPAAPGEYTQAGMQTEGNVPHYAQPRADLKPLEITQPEGPSFEVDGYEVRWQKWRFRVGFTAREGLVLHTVGYEDRGALRSILLPRVAHRRWSSPTATPRPPTSARTPSTPASTASGVNANA